ncbi:MAG: S9 family peptidase [Planctomycetaceae bacterium]|nr:S9 family peptidase [Planctomycetaceae bacterium]
MKPLALIASFLMSIVSASLAAQTPDTPILDRELFFGNPQISGGQLSPDGKWISFMKPYNGIMNIWVKSFDQPFEDARPLTNSSRPLYGYSWTEDGRYLLYAKDKDGDENINVFAVDPNASPLPGGQVPESRNLTPKEDVTAQIIHASQANPDRMWVALNDRDKAWHDLYRLDIASGELVLLYENKDRITGYEFDWNDNLRLLTRTDEQGNTVWLRKDESGLTPIYETSVTENAAIAGWDATNEHIYLVTNKGDLNLSTLYKMNVTTLSQELIESDPLGRVDFGALRMDRNTRQIISTSYTEDQTRYYWRDKTWEANYKFLCEKFPGREITFQSSTLDYKKFLIAISGDRYASEAWYFDADSRELIHQYTPRPELKAVEQHLAPMKPVRYPSSDGLEIPAYLTVPTGLEPKNLPVVVLVHGGPKGPRDTWGFDPDVQFLANRGYAVLQPNFRASGGYGKEFLNAGDLQWGKLMQDDITWGVKYLVDSGIADKDRVAIMGGSYGGYATLAGLAYTPELYACGVDIVGPSNLFTLLESVPPYWEAARAFLYGMVGDPKTPEGEALIRAASPLFKADQIIRPLLIIQGANDPRVKQAEADQIVIALRDRGHDVSYILADDEGHGFAKPVNNMAMYAEIERFLAQKLRGRFQEEMPENVARRLEELRVDISTVTYTPATSVVVSPKLPELNLELHEGEEKWDVTIEAQGQQFQMQSTKTIKREGDTWKIETRTKAPFGEMVDAGVYSAELQPISRSLTQGPQSISAKYLEQEIEVSMSGQPQTLSFSGALLCDGPARNLILSGLPLNDGFELIVNVADFNALKVSTQRLKVVGLEEIDSKNYLRVDVTSVENPAVATSYWLVPDSKQVQRVRQVVPDLGNAVMTMIRK